MQSPENNSNQRQPVLILHFGVRRPVTMPSLVGCKDCKHTFNIHLPLCHKAPVPIEWYNPIRKAIIKKTTCHNCKSKNIGSIYLDTGNVPEGELVLKGVMYTGFASDITFYPSKKLNK